MVMTMISMTSLLRLMYSLHRMQWCHWNKQKTIASPCCRATWCR